MRFFMNKKKLNVAYYLGLALLLIAPSITYAEDDDYYGEMYLNLVGVIDLAKNPDPSVPHNVKGYLTGITGFTHRPVYSDYGGGWETWSNSAALIGFSGREDSCSSSFTVFKRIPNTSEIGLELTNSKNTNLKAYVIPRLRFTADVNGGGLIKKYTGTFFESHKKLTSWGYHACFAPVGEDITNGGYKSIYVGNNNNYPVYILNSAESGVYRYSGAPLYLISNGADSAADAYIRVRVTSDLKVIRFCQMSNVVNANINVVMNRSNEIIKESSLNFTCSGAEQDNEQVYLSAMVSEGTLDPSNHSILKLENLDANADKRAEVPWVIGRFALNSNASPALTCKDSKSNDLLKFDNTEVKLPLISKVGEVHRLAIKWAICSSDNVPAGNYRGKAVITVYTKI